MSVTGSCLCGGVSFRIDGWVTPIQACHATRCRKATGAAFAPEMITAKDGFHWLAGRDLIAHYEAPLIDTPPAYRRAFCSRCGSPLPMEMEAAPLVILNPGLLDGDPGVQLFRHAFVGQKACWHTIADDLPQFEGQPPAPDASDLSAAAATSNPPRSRRSRDR